MPVHLIHVMLSIAVITVLAMISDILVKDGYQQDH